MKNRIERTLISVILGIVYVTFVAKAFDLSFWPRVVIVALMLFATDAAIVYWQKNRDVK